MSDAFVDAEGNEGFVFLNPDSVRSPGPQKNCTERDEDLAEAKTMSTPSDLTPWGRPGHVSDGSMDGTEAANAAKLGTWVAHR